MIRRAILAVLLMACASSVFARGYYFNYAQKGGNTANVAGFVSNTKLQQSYPSSTISVYLTGTVTLATLYSTNGGTAKANPFTAGTDASLNFWTDATSFDITLSGTGITTSCGALFPGYPCIAAFTWTNQAPNTSTTNTFFNVLDFGCVADDSTDNSTCFTALNTAATTAVGATIFFPVGIYKTLHKWTPPAGVSIMGVGFPFGRNSTYAGTSVIRGVHTESAVISFKGNQGNGLYNMDLEGGTLTVGVCSGSTPKTVLELGRSSSGSAGTHIISGNLFNGCASSALVYSIASEENRWDNNTYELYGGGALYNYYTAQGDGLSVDTLTGSSNSAVWHKGEEFFNFVDNGGAACIRENTGQSTRGHIWDGAYLISVNGESVQIVDSQDTGGAQDLQFHGVTGEISGSGPSFWWDVSGTVGHIIKGLVIDQGIYDTRVGGLAFLHSSVTLDGARIEIGTQNHVSSVDSTKITNSVILADLDSTGVKRWIYGIMVSNSSLTLGGALNLASVTFANLGAPAVGQLIYCSDCKNSVDNGVVAGAVCVNAGAGAMAVRAGTGPVWHCF